MTNQNDPAHPHLVYEYDRDAGRMLPRHETGGLTKRELLTAMMAQGMMADPNVTANFPMVAEYAVKMADTLIEALNKPTE